MDDLQPTNKKYMSLTAIIMLDFVTIISFKDMLYPFQNQGLSVVISWIFLLIAYVIPYELIVSQLGLTFKNQEGGYTRSRVRSSNSTLGYWTSWMYWVQSVPYMVDISNSIIVSWSWVFLGNNSLSKHMSPFIFGLLTFSIILAFIVIQNIFNNSLETLSIIGGSAMFILSMLFVILTGWSVLHGLHPATQLLTGMLLYQSSHFTTSQLLVC